MFWQAGVNLENRQDVISPSDKIKERSGPIGSEKVLGMDVEVVGGDVIDEVEGEVDEARKTSMGE